MNYSIIDIVFLGALVIGLAHIIFFRPKP